MQSPLSGSTDCVPVYRIRGADLVELYRWKAAIDISGEIDADEITLWYDPVADFHFFDPPCPGSENFYRERPGNHPYSVEKQEYRFAASHLNAGDRLLDVGCGWGHFADYIREINYTGVDMSESAVAHCQNKGLDVRRQFVRDIAAESAGSFDVVASFQVLEHVERPGEFFIDCVRCVRPQGKLIISVPNADSFMSIRENNYLNYPPHHVSWWSLTSLLYLAREHGLSLVACYVDRAEGNELAMHHGAALHSVLRRGVRRGIRNHPLDRALLKVCDGLGKFARLVPMPDALVPHGHSITVVLSRP